MVTLVAPAAWAFDAGDTAMPMPVATAANAMAKTIMITRRRDDRDDRMPFGRQMGGTLFNGLSWTGHSCTYAAPG